MILFSEGNHYEKVTASVNESKRDKFRKDIRKSSLKAKFQEIRSKLVEQLHSSSFQQTLKSLSQRFNQEEFKQIVELLSCNWDNLEFHKTIADNKLENYLIDVVLANKQAISLSQNSQIMCTLNVLTYYYSQITINPLICRQDFVEYLRIHLEKLTMTYEEEINYFTNVVTFLLNITSQLKKDFNIYLAESDICSSIMKKLNQTTRHCREQPSSQYAELAYKARNSSLKLFFNIVKIIDNGQVPTKLVKGVLWDSENLLHHKQRTFLLLSEAMKNPGFWPKFMSDNDCQYFGAQIGIAMDLLQQRCFKKDFLNNKQNKLHQQEIKQFYGLMCFLNELYYEDQNYEVCWVHLIENAFNGYMLGQFIIQAHERRERTYIIEALQLFKHLSMTYEVTGDQLIIVRPADDPQQLLKIFTDKNNLIGKFTSQLCLIILQNLLKKDPKFLHAIMQFRILDTLVEILENNQQNIQPQIISNGIHLCVQLLISEKAIQENKSLPIIMSNKGIVRAIQKWYDHQNKIIYSAAEMFNEILAKDGKNMI